MTQTNKRDSNFDWARKHGADKEVSPLAIIQENSQLPEKEQKRYRQLWTKCEYETLSKDELTEYQALLSQLKARNLKRIEALITLAQNSGKTLGGVAPELRVEDRS